MVYLVEDGLFDEYIWLIEVLIVFVECAFEFLDCLCEECEDEVEVVVDVLVVEGVLVVAYELNDVDKVELDVEVELVNYL